MRLECVRLACVRLECVRLECVRLECVRSECVRLECVRLECVCLCVCERACACLCVFVKLPCAVLLHLPAGGEENSSAGERSKGPGLHMGGRQRWARAATKWLSMMCGLAWDRWPGNSVGTPC